MAAEVNARALPVRLVENAAFRDGNLVSLMVARSLVETADELLPVRVRTDQPGRPHAVVDGQLRGEEDRRKGVPGLNRASSYLPAACGLALGGGQQGPPRPGAAPAQPKPIEDEDARAVLEILRSGRA